uniref:SWIM-type domain-containing protein n=1 Tax=Setaria italica TaxID=4555 RepID=K3ZDK6_SETIT
MIRKRPYKVLHSYAERRYIVVCEKESCPWRVCAKKQKVTGKWNITKVVGPHNCADHELRMKHPQLTSTLIAKRTIIRTVEELYGGYVISYGKALRAKQRAWKMIYGDWEAGYEQLPVLFNAIKVVNSCMHYEYIPKPNEWKDMRQIFFRSFWCFPQCVKAFRHCRPIFSIDAISCDVNNNLVPLVFALVERENNDSWGWFLRLVWLHVVGPGREVGIISDTHQGILNAMREQIEGYAPLHHHWCTRHLAENLLRKDGVKDNFELFQDAARQLEDRAYDVGGWRYEFQCSNMVESFNKLLLGIRAMPVNAIEHLDKAKERAATHEVICFDLGTGNYQVEQRGGTTSDGKVRESRMHVVVLRDFTCTCGKPRQYHFLCSHLVVAAMHRNFDIESMIPHEFSADTLVHTWSPRFVPFRDPREWPPYDGPKYIADLAYRWNKRGSRKRMRHRMVMDQIPRRTRRGRATPFLTDPEQNECSKWRPETHTFHLPFGEMTVTLEDCQKMLGLTIRSNVVTGSCRSDGWREHEQTIGNYCRAWILHLFAYVLFPDATGDTAWGSVVLGFLYRQLCEVCHRFASSASLGGCVYLLQLWMWARLPIGCPEVLSCREWFLGQPPRQQPTWVYLWDQVRVPHTRLERAYHNFITNYCVYVLLWTFIMDFVYFHYELCRLSL